MIEGLLVIIIILLIVMIAKNKRKCYDMWNKLKTEVKNAASGDGGAAESMCSGNSCARTRIQNMTAHAAISALGENAEYFTNCEPPAETSLQTTCDDNKFTYAVNEYGAPGMTYKDWVASQAVDPQVLRNHAEFVKNRTTGELSNSQNITGRTYTPDMHTSYDPIAWQGLRRPQALPAGTYCNPDQVSDMDHSLFAQKPSLVWDTTTTAN